MKLQKQQEGLAPIILIVIIAFIVVSGFTYWRIRQNDNSPNIKTLTSMKSDLPTDLTGLMSIDKIKDLVLAENSGATVKQVELEMINNTLVYKVQLLDGTLLAFNAKDGVKVILSSDEKYEKEEDDIPSSAVVNITFQKAVEIAQSKYPTKTVRKVEFEFEEGKVVYSVRFTDGSRIDVDATSGEINKAKDSLIEDKDKDNNGIDDDKEENKLSESTSGSDQTKTETKNEASEKRDNQENDDDREDDDNEEDEIEYEKPETKEVEN